MEKMKDWKLYVVADDPYCVGTLRFSAYNVELSENMHDIFVDGLHLFSVEGFSGLEQIWPSS